MIIRNDLIQESSHIALNIKRLNPVDVATPPADFEALFVANDGNLYKKDSAGAVNTFNSTFTPLNLSNLIEWWDPSVGVSTTGSDVNSWSGITNNYSFLPKNNSYKPTFVSSNSNMNYRPAVYINPTVLGNDNSSMLSGTYSGSADYVTMVAYVEIESTNGEDAIIGINAFPSGNWYRNMFIGNAGAGTIYSYGNGQTGISYESTTVPATANSKALLMIEYRKTDDFCSWYAGTQSSLGFQLRDTRDGTDSYDYKMISLGWYNGIIPANSFKCGDVIWLSGWMTDQEKTDLATWYGTKYNF